MDDSKDQLKVPETSEIISLSDSAIVDDSPQSAYVDEKDDDDDISVSDIGTIDSAAEFALESCYVVFKHLKKVIGWSSPLLKMIEVIVVTSVYLSIVTATFLFAFHRTNVYLLLVFYTCDAIYIAHLLFITFVALSPASAWSTPNQLHYRQQCRRTCLVDLITAIPLEYILFRYSEHTSIILRGDIYAAGRLNRFLRVYRIAQFFSRKKNDVILGTRHSDILSATCALTLLIHVSACIWYSMNCRPFLDDYVSYPLCWATVSKGYTHPNASEVSHNFGLPYTPLESFEMHSWTLDLFQVGESVNLDFFLSLYIISVYWSTATALSVGYGDYRGLNYDEIRLSILTMLFGACITNGLVVGSLTSLLTNVESQRAIFTHRLKIIKRYLEDNNYPSEIAESIQGFYEYIWFKKKGQTIENMYETLPLSLQSEICLSVNRCALSKSPMFQKLDEGFLRSIALKIKNHFYLPGQIVINKGTVSRSMYYIVRGELEVLSDRDNTTAVAVLRAGKLFGEVNLVLNFARTATIRAATHCDLLVLNQHDVTPVLLHYPDARLAMWVYVRELFDTDFESNASLANVTAENAGPASTVMVGKQSSGRGFSPTLSAMTEGDETSTAQGSKLSSFEAKTQQEDEVESVPLKKEQDLSSRFPPLSPTTGFTGNASAVTLGQLNISKDTLVISASAPVFRERAGSFESFSSMSSRAKLHQSSNTSTQARQINAPTAHFSPSTRKVSSSDEPPGSAEQWKPIPAFEKPDELTHVTGSGELRNRRFTWVKGESVYKQVRRPYAHVLPSDTSELHIGKNAALLRSEKAHDTTLVHRLWTAVKNPCIEEDGQFAMIWKTIVCLVVIAQWYIYLYYASFEDGYSPGMLGLTYLLDSVHVVDIVFSLMTIVISPRKTYETYNDIFHYRIKRVAFYLDLLAALPLDLVCVPFVLSTSSVRPSRLVTICKLNKLAKVWVIPQRFKYLEDQLYIPLSAIRPAELITYILMGIHFSACLWFMDSNIDQILFEKPHTDMWMEQFNSIKKMEQVLKEDNTSRSDTYILSLYWATATMSTTGYGDIVAMTSLEYHISILVMVFGLVLFAYSLASYASLLTNQERPKVKFQSIVFAMDQFMVENRLDKVLRMRVLRYLQLQWHTYNGLTISGNTFLLYDLPEALQEDLASDGIVKLLGDIPLFYGTDLAFRQTLGRKCSRYIFPPNEYVLYSGDLSRDMYIVVRGYCESYLGNKEKSLGLIGPGQYFGEAGMLYGLPRPTHVVTRTHCDLLAVPHSEFQRIMKNFPTVNKEICEIQENTAVLRAVKLNHARVWRLASQFPYKQESLFTLDEPPSFVILSEEERKEGEGRAHFDRLGRLSFLRRLLMQRTVRPDGKFATRLACARLVVIMLLLVITPVHITFLPQAIGLYVIGFMLDATTAAYMYLRLHSAYYDASCTLVSHPLLTATNYLMSAFSLDMIASFPLDIVAMLFYFGNVYENLHTIVLFRLNRLVQAYEVFLAFSHWEQEVLLRRGMLKAIKHLCYFGLYVHIIACFWAYLACPTSAPEHVTPWNPEERLMEFHYHNHSEFISLHKNCRDISWYSISGFTKYRGPLDFYVISVLFTLEMVASVGYGHITPQTRTEYIISIILMVHGVIFFGYIIASITASLVNADTTRAKFNERVKKLRNQMLYELVPVDLQKKVLRHIEYEFSRSQGMQAHLLFSNLPPSLRGDVSFVLFESLISSVPIFETIDQSFHRMLAMCLKEAFFLEGETVIFAGDMGQEMYFIHRGICEIMDQDGIVTVCLGPGRFFGEVSVMYSIPRTVTIRAQTNTDLFVLTKSDLQDVLENYPDIKREIERIAMVRLHATGNYNSSKVSQNLSNRRLSRSSAAPGSGVGIGSVETRQGRKHKSHHSRSLMDQLASALPRPFNNSERHEQRRYSMLTEEYQELLDREEAEQQGDTKPAIRPSLFAHQLMHAVSSFTQDWLSSHSLNFRRSTSSQPGMSAGNIEADGALSRQPSGVRSGASDLREQGHSPPPTASNAPAIIPNVSHDLGPGGSQPMMMNSTLNTKESTPKIQSGDRIAKSLRHVPSIQVSPSHDAVPEETNDVMPASSGPRTPPSTSITSNFSGEVHEVYMSDQTIDTESKITLDVDPIGHTSTSGRQSQASQSSANYSIKSDRSRVSYHSMRSELQAPVCFAKWCRCVGRLMNRLLPSNFVINPESRLLLIFNLLLTVCGAVSNAVLFYQVAFVDFSVELDIVLGLCTCVYIFNIYVRMHTAYYDNYGDLVRDYKTVRRFYMHRPTGFLVDILSALPVGLLIFIKPGSIVLLRTVANVRFVQLTRVYMAFHFFRTWERRLNAPILFLRSLRDLGILLMLFHICACFWYMVACPNAHCIDGSWVSKRHLSDSTKLEIYVNAVYFIVATMTSSGYGDIHPQTMEEAALCIPIIMLGKFALGLIIGDLASTLSNLELARVEIENMLGVIVNQMKDQSVPMHLQKRVIQHIKYDWLRNRGHSLRDLLEHLPHCLRAEVFEAVYSDQLRSITLFEQAPDYLIRRLSCMCEQQVFLPGDFITKRGDIGQKVYIIRRGSVVVYHTAPSAPEYFLYSGSIYGDVQIVFPTIPYEHNLVADDPSDVLVINQSDVQQLFADDPHFYFKVRRYIQRKYADIIQDRRPTMTHKL